MVDVFDLLQRADMKRVHAASGGTEANFSCFGAGHNHGDESPSAYMNVDTTAWMCQGCHKRGNAVSFWAESQGVSIAEAQRFLRETYGITFSEPIGGSMQSEIDMRFAPIMVAPDPVRPSMGWLSSTRVDWFDMAGGFTVYMAERGFLPEVLDEWAVGYDYLSDRITIPVFDIDGRLFGFKGRSWDGREPKYLVLGDRRSTTFGFEPYEHSQVVFGLHRARECKTVVLFEGELNSVAASQVGVERPCSAGMSYFSDRQAELIAREADECVVFYDGDAAGVSGVHGRVGADGQRTLGVVDKLEPHMPVRIVRAHDQDPAELVRLGRGSEIIELIESAEPSLDFMTLLL